MLEFSFQLDTSGRVFTVREAMAVDKTTNERILVMIKHNKDGTFEASCAKYKEIKASGQGLKGALGEFNRQYEEVRKNYK